LKKKLQILAHRIFLPRGRNYKPEPLLENTYERHYITHLDKSICVLYKSNINATAKYVVVLAHPYLNEAKKFFLSKGHADMYVQLGFDVVLFDFNGFGESSFVDFNYCEDVFLVANFVSSKFPNRRMIGHGISFGASHIITYSTKAENKFCKIVVENCLDSNLSYYKKRNKKLYWLSKILMFLLPNLNKDHDYLDKIGRLQNIEETLFIYNSADELTTLDMGFEMVNRCNSDSKFFKAKGKHLQALEINREEYIQQILSISES